jgi:hypothetical protein
MLGVDQDLSQTIELDNLDNHSHQRWFGHGLNRTLDYEVMRIVAKSPAAEEGFLELLRLALKLVTKRYIALAPNNQPHHISRVRQVKVNMLEFCQNLRNIRPNLTQTTLGLVFSALIFIVIVAAGTAVAYIELDNLALVSSPNCGLWMHPKYQDFTVYSHGKAGEMVSMYYKTCYENDLSLQDCNLFSHQSLFTTMTDNEDCPFRGDVCLLGKNSAVSLDTGLIDSKYLGINSPHRPFFRRRNICAPLVIDGYSNTENDSNLTTFTSFYYGPRTKENNVTILQTRNLISFPLGSPGYNVAVMGER